MGRIIQQGDLFSLYSIFQTKFNWHNSSGATELSSEDFPTKQQTENKLRISAPGANSSYQKPTRFSLEAQIMDASVSIALTMITLQALLLFFSLKEETCFLVCFYVFYSDKPEPKNYPISEALVFCIVILSVQIKTQ